MARHVGRTDTQGALLRGLYGNASPNSVCLVTVVFLCWAVLRKVYTFLWRNIFCDSVTFNQFVKTCGLSSNVS